MALKLETVVWYEGDLDEMQDKLNEKLNEVFPLFDEVTGEQHTSSPPWDTVEPPPCPDCKKQPKKWDELMAYNAGGDGFGDDWYICCRPCFEAMS
jgi:hypothetical protein